MKRVVLYIILVVTAFCLPATHQSHAVLSLADDTRPRFLLSDQDVQLYRSIFSLQQKGEMANADQAISQLKDKRLMGHVLYQRYLHPTAYSSTFDELKAWMDRYADHPGADRIYDLALRKAPKETSDVAFVKEPKKRTKIKAIREPTMVSATPYHKYAKRGGYDKALENRIDRMLRKGQRSKAVDVVFQAEKTGKYKSAEVDYLKSKIAASYMYKGHVKMAYELSSQAFFRSLDKVPMAGWVYGLSAWYNGNYEQAAKGFENAAISRYASGWMQSAASFWAARSYGRLLQPHKVTIWLTKASEHPRTFYGLLARQAAGEGADFNWKKPQLTRDMVRSMARSRATMRALALMDIGRHSWAEQELLYVSQPSDLMEKAMVAFAQHFNMPELSLRLGGHVKAKGGKVYDAALYPEVNFDAVVQTNKDKAKAIDPDLLNAIARQESRFNPYAVSASGAVGLMQLMPDTAKYVAKKYNLVMGSQKTLLLPDYNLKFGQYYLHSLLRLKEVDGDVLKALIAYNAGPGNLRKWQKQWADVKDPLLFIELLPASETRSYVEHVLANYWIYRIKNGRSLKALKPLLMGDQLLYANISKDLPYDIAQWR